MIVICSVEKWKDGECHTSFLQVIFCLPHQQRHPGRPWCSASLHSSLPQQALHRSSWTFQVMPVQLKCHYWYICSLYFGGIDLFKARLFCKIHISPFFFLLILLVSHFHEGWIWYCWKACLFPFLTMFHVWRSCSCWMNSKIYPNSFTSKPVWDIPLLALMLLFCVVWNTGLFNSLSTKDTKTKTYW